MRSIRSDYIHWAKFKTPVRYALSTSEVPHFRLDRLPISISDLDLDGASHPRYGPLRERIAKHARTALEEVVSADGTSMANFLALAALVTPGDEVLIERPTYEPILGAASFLGAVIKRFDRDASNGFRIDLAALERAIEPSTRLIVITNLHNPSCNLSRDDELREVGRLARKVGATVLVDEVYLDSASEAQPSAVHLGSEFVTTNSLTKVYGLSGLRCGWILARSELAERMWRLNDLFGVNQAHPAERLSCLAFDHLETVAGDNHALLERNRAMFDAFVAARPDLECAPSSHGLTAFPRWFGGDTQRLNAHLRRHYDTCVVPGCWFEAPTHFRLGFGLPSSDFEAALERLRAALDDLR